MIARRTLRAENEAAIKKRVLHKRAGRKPFRPAMTAPARKSVYPQIPQIGRGNPPKTEYGLWETVSQLMAFEMAQKLLYSISV
jgi:hypothetical protein